MKTMWKKLLLPAFLSMIVVSNFAMAAVAAPEEHRQQDETAGPAYTQSDSDPDKRGRRHWKHKDQIMIMGNGIHQQMYFSLLAEKYTPQSQKEWSSVLEESAKLQDELKSLLANPANKDRKELWQDKAFRRDMKNHRERHKEVYKQFHDAIKSRDAGNIKTALSSLLPVFREQNKMLANLLGKLKQQASADEMTSPGRERLV